MPVNKLIKLGKRPFRRGRSKSDSMYQNNLNLASKETVRGKVTERGHSLCGEYVGTNTLNRRLNGIPDYDVTYKVLLLGDSGVGKTAMLERLDGQPFTNNHVPTVGIDFIKKTFDIDGVRVRLQIWDTAGQERFRTITKLQYRDTKGVLLLYDITSQTSFDMLDYWLESIDEELDGNNTEPVPVFIVGNKADLSSSRIIEEAQGVRVSSRHYCRGFLETSAKSGQNVESAFQQLAHAMLEIYDPKLMDTFLSPYDRKLKYDRLAQQQVCNGMCACGGIPTTKGSFRLKPEKPKALWKRCFSV